MSEILVKNYVITTPLLEILKQVKRELTNGKLRDIQPKGSEIRVTCPHHGDGKEKNPDCYINEDGVWHCFACGASGKLPKFIGECFDKDEKFGEDWLLDNCKTELQYCIGDDDLYDFSFEKKETKEYLDESILNTFQTWHPYLSKRGLKKEVCEKFKLRYDPKSECIVFPVWDETNRLYMLTRRSVNSKKFIIDSDKEKPLYLYNYVKGKNLREVTIVESQFNCLTLWGWGIPSIAMFGTGTQHQYEILNNSNIIHYFLCFDGDNAGDKGIRNFLKNIRKDVFVDIILMPRGKDVNDLSEQEFDNLTIISSEDWLKDNV